MKLAIIGSRNFQDYKLLKSKCDFFLGRSFDNEIVIISGGAKGADQLAERYARENNMELQVFKADWDAHGRSAGMKRNLVVQRECTHVIAFWDGKSPGTNHMIQTIGKEKPIRVINF